MIIAMDTEEMLQELGYTDIVVVSSCATALAEIDDRLPACAILDFNLGDENSSAIAERLTTEGVPFCFATGYGDAMEEIGESAAVAVLQKPFSKADLQRALEGMAS